MSSISDRGGPSYPNLALLDGKVVPVGVTFLTSTGKPLELQGKPNDKFKMNQRVVVPERGEGVVADLRMEEVVGVKFENNKKKIEYFENEIVAPIE